MPYVKTEDVWAVTYEHPSLEPIGANQYHVYTYLEWCYKEVKRMGEGFSVVETTNDKGEDICYVRRNPVGKEAEVNG